MKILLLGSGGREHALAWKISQSKFCTELYIAPGNAGTEQYGKNLSFAATDFEAITNCCNDKKIDMVIVGPEEPLVNGVIDHLMINAHKDLLLVGPAMEAAQLEGSKAFAKVFMQRHGIPTANYKEFSEESFQEGIQYLKQQPLPVVLKADGLAAGKGVIICQNHVEAVAEFEWMIQRSKFGEAGKRVVVESFLDGIEISVFVLTDGKDYILLPEAKDYKRIGEGDKGLNTGGMGAISPVPFADDHFMQKVKRRIIEPTIKGLEKDQIEYKGFIFFGLIKVGEDPMVIEYNCRMGDPETEVVIPRIKSDLVELFIATAKKELKEKTIDIDDRYASTIVAVSNGYPNEYKKGIKISGLSASIKDGYLFHMGTKKENDETVTNGGRVICSTALANNLNEALLISRELIEQVEFEGMYFRRDIGYEFDL